MNKNELVKEIAGRAKLKLSDTEKFVNAFISTVSDELKKNGKVTLVGFGTFALAHRKEKRGVNPKTGAKITIKAKNVPVFKPGKKLKEWHGPHGPHGPHVTHATHGPNGPHRG